MTVPTPVINPQLTYTSLLKPGILPPQIGLFNFSTSNTVSFDLNQFIPNSAKQFDITVTINCGFASQQSAFTVWLWTELENDQQDVKFKQGYSYPQNSFSSDSETFTFTYSSHNPRLFLRSNYDKGENIWIVLYIVGYKQ